MAIPQSREQLGEYALRALGAPVIEVNVDDEQLSDRIDEALQFYQEYHSDATKRTFFKHRLTQTDFDNKYITLPDALLSVTRVLPIGGFGGDAKDMFSTRYQMFFNDVMNLRNPTGDLLNYELSRQKMALMDLQFTGLSQQINFVRHMNRLTIEVDWEVYMAVGEYIIIEGFALIDPDQYIEIYNDRFLKKYLIALVKRQWATNLIKFEGMQLPGGVTISGRAMYEDAMNDILKIEEDMQSRFEAPPDFFVG
jgi:hypothetical protein